MKYLESVRLVQFFLFEKQDIRLREISGIFGPNGSGKSSVLDAIQIAMFGANSRLAALNAQADEAATERSFRAYCLGQYGETTEHRARENATTYITLVWRDSQTNEPISMGVCMYASNDRETHEVLGRYIIRGFELTLGDHLEIVDGQERPRDWKTFRHQLLEHSKALGEEPIFSDAERYMRAALLALRGSAGVPAYESFTRAFRFALRMRFDKSVDQIVRNDVLESRPTNIKKFKEVTESFRRLKDMVAQVEVKIEDGDRICRHFATALQESKRAVIWTGVTHTVDFEIARTASALASKERHEAEEALHQVENDHYQARVRLQHSRSEARRFRSLREAHADHRKYGGLQAQIESQNNLAEKNAGEVQNSLKLVRRTLGEVAHSLLMKNQTIAVAAAIEPLDVLAKNVETLGWDRLSMALDAALGVAKSAWAELFKMGSSIEHDLEEAKTSLKAAKDALQRAKEGRLPLSRHVQRLLTELRDQGLHPRPVCDLVQITNTKWQPIIEAYLGPHLQALLVAAHEEKEAFKIYRGLSGQRAIYGAKIVMESRQVVGKVVDAASVAALIDGNVPAAVAYLQRQFGDTRQAETDAEALAGPRTLMRNGMLISAGEMDRLQQVPPGQLRIGTSAGGQQDAIRADIGRWESEVTKLETRQAEVSRLLNRLKTISDDAAKQFILERWEEMNNAKQALESLRKSQAETASKEYTLLGEQEQAWETKASKLEVTVSELATQQGAAGKTLEQKMATDQAVARTLETALAAMNESHSHKEYDRDEGVRQWAALQEKHKDQHEEMVRYCSEQQKDAETKRDSASMHGVNNLGKFFEKYHEQVAPDLATDWRKAHEWITALLGRLRDTELVNFKVEMENAYQASQETFRTDVAIALSNNLDWLDQTMERLNQALSTCPVFTNGERYHFRREVRPHLKPLLQFIKNIAAHGPGQDLFGSAGEIPAEFKELLEDKLALGAAGIRSPLDDYREFFEFDIEILREDPVTKMKKAVGHLSKRLGPGSGGEHRAPLYVIAGAALASAYRLDRGSTDGIRLILLDEAFNKMDMTNIVATMRYLEELGLQVLMATPGENLGILTAFLHRYYDILRDPDCNVLMLVAHDVSAATRTMFREDLPEFNPALIEQELSTMRSGKAVLTAKDVN